MIRPVFRRVSVAMVVASLVFTIGAHWALLQTVAWAGMLVTYAQDSSLESAIRNTFDGKHPCQLCKVVASGKASEKKKETRKSNPKIDVFILPTVLMPLERLPFSEAFSAPVFSEQADSSPPTPPPRFV